MSAFLFESLRFVGIVAFFALPLASLRAFNEADKANERPEYPYSGFCPDCPAHEEGGEA